MAESAPRSSKSAEELLCEFRDSGRQQPFEELVRRYAPMVFNTCYRVTKDKHDAEDATQAVFLSLAVQVKANKEIRFIGPWLQQVGHRMALDMRRSHKRRKAREEKHSHLNGDRMEPEPNSADSDELKRILTEELGELPSKYRTPLVLFYFGGMSREQIAEELRCKPSTLGVRMHRAREMLGTRLTRRGLQISGAMLAVALASAVRSAVASSLIERTSEAATRLTFGGPMRPGAISIPVMRLVRGASKAMVFARIKTGVAAVLVASSAIIACAGAVAQFHGLNVNVLRPTEIQFQQQFDLRGWMESIIRHIPNPLQGGHVDATPTSAQRTTPVAPVTPTPAPVVVAQRNVVHSQSERETMISGPTSVAVGPNLLPGKVNTNLPVSVSAGFASQAAPPSYYATAHPVGFAANFSAPAPGTSAAARGRANNTSAGGTSISPSMAAAMSQSSAQANATTVSENPVITAFPSQGVVGLPYDPSNGGPSDGRPIASITESHTLPPVAIASLTVESSAHVVALGPEASAGGAALNLTTSDSAGGSDEIALAPKRRPRALMLSMSALAADLSDSEMMMAQPMMVALTPDAPETRPVTNFPSAPVAIDDDTVALIHPLLARAMLQSVAPQSIPEPASLGVLAASSFLLLRRRRR